MGSQFNYHPGVPRWCQSIAFSTPCLTSSFELQQCHLFSIVHWREQQSEKTIKICQPFPLMTLPFLCRAAHYSASFAAMRPRKDPGNSTLPPNPFWKGSGRVKMTDLGVFDRTRCFVSKSARVRVPRPRGGRLFFYCCCSIPALQGSHISALFRLSRLSRWK